jgi:RNA ligase (TIGR02306 family)
MSEFHVVVTKLDKIERHPNADTLELSTVCGYPVIFKENQYSPGDKVVYVPTDSLVPVDNPLFSFLVELDAFDKPKNVREGKVRVKAKKLRGVYSIGLVVPIRCTCKADERGVRTHDEDCHLLWDG